MPLLGFLLGPVGRYLLLAAGIALVALSGWLVVHHFERSGYEQCRGEVLAANAEQMAAQQKVLDDARKHGDELTAKLAEAYQQLNDQKATYETSIRRMRGLLVPADLGRLSDAAAAGVPLSVPPAAGRPAAPAREAATDPGIDAEDYARSVVDNYTRANRCIDQLNALIDWHQATDKE